MHTVEITPPYLLFLADETRETYVKTGRGIVDWRRALCGGQLRLSSDTLDLGLPDLSIEEAKAAGVRTLIIGTSQVGGDIQSKWINKLAEAAAAGLDIVAGLHTRLSSVYEINEAARRGHSRIIDVRSPPADIPVGSGKPRSGQRILTVGTDCALGKKYTALQLEKDMRETGMNADFRASGQTGIMIAGRGIPIDCVVADFISGAAELLSPANEDDHWDVIEGQGGIFHPGYAAVTHGLLLGSQPDAFVVCHAAGREHMAGWDHVPLPSIGEVIQRTVDIGRLTNPDIRCAGISVNTSQLTADQREEYLTNLSQRYALPCVDPVVTGCQAIIENL